MTNAEIIYTNQMLLASDGILKVEDDEIQPIHTYAGWQRLGYQVKKGEKAVAKFAVWKYLKKKDEDVSEEVDGEEKKNNGKCYMKVAAFFTDEQVEKIEK